MSDSAATLPASVLPAALRMLTWSAVLGAGAVFWGKQLAQGLFPLWRLEIPLLDARWRVDRLWIDHQGADQVIRVLIGLRGCVTVSLGTLCGAPEPLGNASTLVGNLTMPSVLMLAVGLGRPGGSRSACLLRIPCLGCALLLLWMADIPLILGAAFWTVWRDTVLHGRASLLVGWASFLQAGGRPTLALGLAAAAVWAAQRLSGARHPTASIP